jgi:oligogalacturonide lyase
VNSDETALAACYCLGEDKYYTSKMPRNQWIREIWKAKLPNAIYTIDIPSGTINEFYHENEWLGHVQFSPTDPTLIEFCHEGPGHDEDRMWMVRSDGSGLRKLHDKKYPRELQTHEFWSPDGAKIWCDFQTPSLLARVAPFMETVTYPRFYLASVDTRTYALKRYPYPMRYASRHFNISPDQTMFCGDGEGGSFRLCRSGKWIFLFRIDNGKLRVERLCSMAGHSWKTYPEPNSHFTPDGKWVVFQSDVGGTTQVYAVEVDRTH